MNSYPLILLMVLPLSGFMLLLVPSRWRHPFSLATHLFCAGLAVTGFFHVQSSGGFFVNAGLYPAPWGIVLNIGPAEAFLTVLFTSVATAIVAHSRYALPRETRPEARSTYYTLYHLALASVLGILMTGDIFTSFVFLEVSGLTACGMTVVRGRADSLYSAVKYMVLGSLGSGLILMGIAYLYGVTGHLNLIAIGDALNQHAGRYPAIIPVTLALFMTGLGLKSAIFPLHSWLPDAYQWAPTPTSAFFSSLSSKAPAILLIKLLFGVYGPLLGSEPAVLTALAALGASGMLVGSLLARRQKNLKRLLGYSSIAQMGYVFLGIGLGSAVGLGLALFHMAAHSLSKAVAFMASGTLSSHTGSDNLLSLKGIGAEAPFTLGAFAICAFSMTGIPLLPGFISKFNLALASLQTGKPWFLPVILLSSLLNASYYFPILIDGFFGGSPSAAGYTKRSEASIGELLPLAVLCVFLIGTGFFSGPILILLQAGFFSG